MGCGGVVDIRLTLRTAKNRLVDSPVSARPLGIAALTLLSCLAILWVLPIVVGTRWIQTQWRGQYPAIVTEGLSWRLLPRPSVTIRRVEVPNQSIIVQGDMHLMLALAPLLKARLEPTSFKFSNLIVTKKTFTSPGLNGRLTWSQATQTLGIALSCPKSEWARGEISHQTLDVDIGGPTLCGLSPALSHPLGTVALHAQPTLSSGLLALDALTLSLGTSRFNGSAQLAFNDMPRLDVTLSAPRIDLDSGQPSPSSDPMPLLPVKTGWNLKTGWDWTPIASAHAALAQPPASSLSPPHWAFALPQGIFATVSIKADEIVHHHLSFHAVDAQITLDDGELVLNRLEAIPPGGGTLSIDATLAAPGAAPILDGSVRMTADHPEALLTWAGLGAGTALPALQVSAEGTATDGLITLSKIAVKSADLGFTGSADLETTAHSLLIDQAQLVLSGTPWDQAPLTVHGVLAPDDQGLARLSDLKLTSGQTRITGSVGVAPVLGRSTLTADLGGDHWVLDTVATLQSTPPVPKPSPKGKGKSASPAPFAPPKIQLSPLAPAPNAATPTSLNIPDIRLNLHPQSASFQGQWIEQPAVEIAVSPDMVSVDHFSARLWGGDVVGSGRITLRGLPQISATFSAGGVEIGQAQLTAGPLRLSKGTASGNGRCSSIGRNSADMKRHLECAGQFRINAGEISGIDLGAINRAARQVSHPVGILGLAQAGAHGGRTPFTALTATIKLMDGTLSTNDARLDADGGMVTLRGSYDQPAQTMDAKADLNLTDTQLPTVGLHLSGPIAQPHVALDMNDLLRASAAQALRQKVKGPELLKGLIKSLSQP